MATRTVELRTLGPTPYRQVWDVQHRIFDSLLDGSGNDTLILCEHKPVFTLGRVTDVTNVLFSDAELAKIGAEKFEIERGGDVTFHGPGQIVGYPLLNLAHFKEDLGWYLRSLEEVIIRTLATYGIEAFRVEGRTGVWVGKPPFEEKICAIGIKASRWCTMHGFAFNVNTDLRYFDYIVPCGISDRNVTSMKKLLGRDVDIAEVRDRLSRAFEEVFDVRLVTTSDE
ncbi:MAG: lipoyl(octanoyl) transferase LipB [Bacteroidetes bacterium]|nr:lipoyl(octanoyl) transferase LipB [Bacteroidota bacterium]